MENFYGCCSSHSYNRIFRTTIKIDVIKPILAGIWQGGSVISSNDQSTTVIQDVHNILHWIDRRDPDGPSPDTPSQDAQYQYWEYPVRYWAISNGYTSLKDITVPIAIHQENSDDYFSKYVTGISDSYKKDDTISFIIQKNIIDDFISADIFLNENLIQKNFSKGKFSFSLSSILNISTNNTLSIVIHKENEIDEVLTKSFVIE